MDFLLLSGLMNFSIDIFYVAATNQNSDRQPNQLLVLS